jgi:hypothetical protein
VAFVALLAGIESAAAATPLLAQVFNAIADAYEPVITTYGVTRLDMDIEGMSLSNSAGIDRRNRSAESPDAPGLQNDGSYVTLREEAGRGRTRSGQQTAAKAGSVAVEGYARRSCVRLVSFFARHG